MTTPASNVRRRVRLINHVIADQSAELELTATYSLDRWIAQARREMGESRWAELNKDWL